MTNVQPAVTGQVVTLVHVVENAASDLPATVTSTTCVYILAHCFIFSMLNKCNDCVCVCVWPEMSDAVRQSRSSLESIIIPVSFGGTAT